MKTQISRNSFKAAKRYSGVYQQQGRMLTDADWNNLVDILKGHLAEALKDVVGNGSPRTGKLKITTDRQIQPGDLYVGGLRAELPGTNPIDANTQEDFPGSPNLPATGPYIVYADVWERSLTALEDPDLRDAGLNGADTCTRTQTMLQVKVCPEDVDPEKDIPQHGDASLTLTLHDSQESDDPCDPCAGQIGADEGRIGNYLFRVEVHLFEEETEDQPTRLILKWSSENGAEQYEAQDEALMPPGFVVSGRYTYEFLNLMSEKHLGVHLNPDPDFSPTFFELKQTYEIPEKDPDDPDWYVRRWDGYCELTYDGSIWSLVEGFDKGVTLSTAVADTAPGHVSLNSALSINLEALKLDLELKDKKFVAGDYWLAPVREAEHVPDSTENDPDNTVLAGSPPEGIIHHYLGLTRVEADGTVDLLDNDDAEKRRHNFPPLTDLLAGDVGYLRDPPDCANGWFDATHDNVEKALNRLCELTAAHIPYKADCSQGLFQGFEGTVKQALDTVCSIQAGDVGFTETLQHQYLPGTNRGYGARRPSPALRRQGRPNRLSARGWMHLPRHHHQYSSGRPGRPLHPPVRRRLQGDRGRGGCLQNPRGGPHGASKPQPTSHLPMPAARKAHAPGPDLYGSLGRRSIMPIRVRALYPSVCQASAGSIQRLRRSMSIRHGDHHPKRTCRGACLRPLPGSIPQGCRGFRLYGRRFPHRG